jgi:hypothetical protein
VTRTNHPQAKTAILAIICISYFMVILDNSIIFTGLPRIESTMGFSPTGLTCVQDAHTLVFGGLLLLGARAGDIVGRRRMFVAGLVLFGLASFMVGVAPFARRAQTHRFRRPSGARRAADVRRPHGTAAHDAPGAPLRVVDQGVDGRSRPSGAERPGVFPVGLSMADWSVGHALRWQRVVETGYRPAAEAACRATVLKTRLGRPTRCADARLKRGP